MSRSAEAMRLSIRHFEVEHMNLLERLPHHHSDLARTHAVDRRPLGMRLRYTLEEI